MFNNNVYKNVIRFIFSYCFIHISTCTSVRRITIEFKQVTLQMNGYMPSRTDDYVAISRKVEAGYLVKFEPFASAERVHHMLLYGCQRPARNADFWRGADTCGGSAHILYAWARNAPALELPKNVAFSVGNEDDTVRYFVLQIHYARPFRGYVRDFSGPMRFSISAGLPGGLLDGRMATKISLVSSIYCPSIWPRVPCPKKCVTLHLSDKRPAFFADVMLFVTGQPIPPHRPAFLNNISCKYTSDVKLHPFAFRVHTHAMGRVVSGYVRHAGVWSQIGKRNPQWPQLFQPVESDNLVIQKDDFMAATCRFDSSDKNVSVPMGAMGVDEMCNFYMMFYRNADEPDPFTYGAFCGGNENPEMVEREYPVDGTTLLPDHPEWEHTAHQTTLPFGVIEKAKITQIGGLRLGQVAGLAIDNRDRIVIFHRAHRTWNYQTFDMENVLNEKTPIDAHTILIGEHDQNGRLTLVGKFGKSLFYMPHSIFVDDSNYYYTTDVGSHQVIKWEIVGGEFRSVWRLGEAFVPGSDSAHFCKPAGVAVSRADGSVYVADGYCNSRVIKFSKDGRFLAEWGHATSEREGRNNIALGYFSLPHDITLDEHGRRVFVADRENGRVQAFNEQGDPLFGISNPLFYDTVYSAHYCDDHGLIFIPGGSQKMNELNAFVVPVNATQIEYSFRPTTAKFERPHIIRARGNAVWVGEIAESGGVLWWLQIDEKQRVHNALDSSDYSHNDGLMLRGTMLDAQSASWSGNIDSGKRVVSEHFWTSIFAASLIISAFYACCYLCIYKQKYQRILQVICCCCFKGYDNDSQSNIDRKGFRPLRNLEEDDDNDDESNIDT